MKPFFYSKGNFQPVYFWITVFCLLAVVCVVLRFFSKADLSDTLILGILGFMA